MRVLISSGIWPPEVGGPASHGPELGRFLADRGHSVRAVTTAGPGRPGASRLPDPRIAQGPPPADPAAGSRAVGSCRRARSRCRLRDRALQSERARGLGTSRPAGTQTRQRPRLRTRNPPWALRGHARGVPGARRPTSAWRCSRQRGGGCSGGPSESSSRAAIWRRSRSAGACQRSGSWWSPIRRRR